MELDNKESLKDLKLNAAIRYAQSIRAASLNDRPVTGGRISYNKSNKWEIITHIPEIHLRTVAAELAYLKCSINILRNPERPYLLKPHHFIFPPENHLLICLSTSEELAQRVRHNLKEILALGKSHPRMLGAFRGVVTRMPSETFVADPGLLKRRRIYTVYRIEPLRGEDLATESAFDQNLKNVMVHEGYQILTTQINPKNKKR